VSENRIVVMGASAGGVTAMQTVVASLPREFPAPILVVLHTWPAGDSYMPEILSRCGPLPAAHGRHGAAMERGRIYVAPPDHHLAMNDGHLVLNRAPTENMHRPSIDVTFRSAARNYGPNVIAVLMTGADDDGAAGLLAIKRAGGTVIVQDPEEALFPEMPLSALVYVHPDLTLRLAEIGPALARLVAEPPVQRSIAMSEQEVPDNMPGADEKELGEPSAFTCPDCGGTLWEVRDGELLRFRCRVGHIYSPTAMLDAEAEANERALWAAIRSLEESAAVSRRIAEKTGVLKDDFLRRAEERLRHAATLREMLTKEHPEDR
jgi:two-component system chemotaxis response regulator CheB